MKHVLITGGGGSLGQELALHLVRRGHWVRAYDLPACDFGPLEETPGVEVVRGDIRDARAVARAATDVDAAVHLAALLPPVSERDRRATMAVNVSGTEQLVRALEVANRTAHLILASSVCVYGDTAGEDAPIRATQPLRPRDWYGESKMAAEEAVRQGGVHYTILRISGISVPAFLEPPAIWPFGREQRIEFVCRTDVVEALATCVDAPAAVGRTFNVAGGPTWRMLGGIYVGQLNQLMGLSPDGGRYLDRPGYFDWYDTVESQVLLNYQRTSFSQFLELLEVAVVQALDGSDSE